MSYKFSFIKIKNHMFQDTAIEQLIAAEHERQVMGIELIASEKFS